MNGWLAAAAGALVVGGLVLALPNLWMRTLTAKVRYGSIESVPARPVALVLGAAVAGKNQPSRALSERLAVALELYRAGKVTRLLVSGRSEASGYNEAAGMRRWLLERGVPAADIISDEQGTRTITSVRRAVSALGLRSAIIVSTDYHLPRALYLAGRAGMDAVAVGSADGALRHIWRYRLRELAACWLALVEGAALRPS
jgi:SanA protein